MLFCIVLILDDDLSFTARAALAILAFLTPSILTSFSGLIFTERNFLFFLGCLTLCIKRFEQTQSAAWAVVGAVSAQIMIYNEETAPLLLLGFAVGRLILRCKDDHKNGWDYDRLRDKVRPRLGSRLFRSVVFTLLHRRDGYSCKQELRHDVPTATHGGDARLSESRCVGLAVRCVCCVQIYI